MVSILGQEGIWLSLKSLKLTTRIPLKWCCASPEGASTLSTNRTRSYTSEFRTATSQFRLVRPPRLTLAKWSRVRWFNETGNEPVLIAFSFLREEAAKTGVTIFVDNTLCASVVVNEAFVPFRGGKLGHLFSGSISEFRVRKTIIGE